MHRIWSFLFYTCFGLILTGLSFTPVLAAVTTLQEQPVGETPHYPPVCNTCHDFTGTCWACHQTDQPVQHFNVECSACHTPGSWKNVNPDHTQWEFTNCRDCHLPDRPQTHFQVVCSVCHQTGDWTNVNFSHQSANVTDCQVCHTPPPAHWGLTCTQCHSPGMWSNLNLSWHTFPINHEGARRNCKDCHTPNGVDCKTCHKNEKGGD